MTLSNCLMEHWTPCGCYKTEWTLGTACKYINEIAVWNCGLKSRDLYFNFKPYRGRVKRRFESTPGSCRGQTDGSQGADHPIRRFHKPSSCCRSLAICGSSPFSARSDSPLSPALTESYCGLRIHANQSNQPSGLDPRLLDSSTASWRVPAVLNLTS